MPAVLQAVNHYGSSKCGKRIDNKCALICPTDIYAIKLLPVARKHRAGIMGFDNIRLIDELNLILDSVSYDIPLTAKTAVDHIINSDVI